MRCFFVSALFFFACSNLSAQNKSEDNEDWDKTFTKIELNAQPDPKSWDAYLKQAAKLPTSFTVNIPSGVYKVTVEFIVDKFGNLGDIKAKNDPGYGLAKKAENIISNYDGAWKPATQCGRLVKSYSKQVIEFVVKK